MWEADVTLDHIARTRGQMTEDKISPGRRNQLLYVTVKGAGRWQWPRGLPGRLERRRTGAEEVLLETGRVWRRAAGVRGHLSRGTHKGWTRAPGLCKLHTGTWAWAWLESSPRTDTAPTTWGDGPGRSFRTAPIGPQPPVPFKSWIQYLLWIWDLKVHLKFSLLININKGWDREIADGNSKNVTERFMKYNVRFKMRSFFNFPKGHTHLIHAYAYFGWKYFIFWTPNNQFLCHC